MGKNDYSLWWDRNEVEEYEFESIVENKENFIISTIFIKKNTTVKEAKEDKQSFDLFDFSGLNDNQFVSFERLPISLNKKLFQYDYADFAYTNFRLKAEAKINNLYKLNDGEYVQLN
jgi:CRISPR-associated protein Cas5h